jgi:hypothetical protein
MSGCQEERDLRFRHADVHPALEAELAGPRRGRELRVLGEVLADPAIEVVAKLAVLIEGGLALVAAQEAGGEHLVALGSTGG